MNNGKLKEKEYTNTDYGCKIMIRKCTLYVIRASHIYLYISITTKNINKYLNLVKILNKQIC